MTPAPPPGPEDPVPDLTIVAVRDCIRMPGELSALQVFFPGLVLAAEVIDRYPSGQPHHVRLVP